MQEEAYLRVPLHARDGSVRAYALIDAEDAHWMRFRWSLSNRGYARHSLPKADGPRRSLLLHRVILGLDRGSLQEGDHINGNRLDNRRANLRVVTRAQNMQNVRSRETSTSRNRGVSWYSRGRKWKAQVQVGKRGFYLGSFDDEAEAAAAASLFRLLYMPFTVEERGFSSKSNPLI